MAHHEDHGHSTAAWTSVIILIVGFALGSLAVAWLNFPLLWVAVAIIAVGAIAGPVLAKMGYGAAGRASNGSAR